LLRLGRAYVQQGAFGDAIETLAKAAELDPKSALIFNTRGYAYLRTRDYEAAIRDFSMAISLNNAYANAYWNRGVARRLSKDEPGGKQDMQRAAQLGWASRVASAIPSLRVHPDGDRRGPGF
jgi:Flp pilus assembly protein TadD